MDPLSIGAGAAGLAGFCFKISSVLYTFIDDTRQVDENISSLLDEVRGLSQVLDTISKSLGHNALVAASRKNESLWANVDSSLTECRDTLGRLHQMLRDLEDSSKGGWKMLRMSTKMIKLSMKSKDIIAFKQQVHSHYSGMQLALQTINVCIALHSNSSQENLTRELEGLKTQVGTAMNIALNQQATVTTLPVGFIEQNARISRMLKKLVNEADSVHSSASTVVGDRSTVWGGSVFGDPLTQEQYRGIRDWIPPPIQEESEDASTVSGSRSGYTPAQETDSDSDSDIGSERTKMFEQSGLARLAISDYTHAKAYFQKAVESRKSPNPDTDMKLVSLKSKLAATHCLLLEWDDAWSVLQAMAESRKALDPLGVHCLHAICMAYTENGKANRSSLHSAEKVSERLLIHKKKLVGKQHGSYYESVFLVSQIAELKGEPLEAEGWRNLLPPSGWHPAPSSSSYIGFHVNEVLKSEAVRTGIAPTEHLPVHGARKSPTHSSAPKSPFPPPHELSQTPVVHSHYTTEKPTIESKDVQRGETTRGLRPNNELKNDQVVVDVRSVTPSQTREPSNIDPKNHSNPGPTTEQHMQTRTYIPSGSSTLPTPKPVISGASRGAPNRREVDVSTKPNLTIIQNQHPEHLKKPRKTEIADGQIAKHTPFLQTSVNPKKEETVARAEKIQKGSSLPFKPTPPGPLEPPSRRVATVPPKFKFETASVGGLWQKPTPLATGTALYDFKRRSKAEICFKAGQTVHIIAKTDKQNDWWTGASGGYKGTFPGNYIQLDPISQVAVEKHQIIGLMLGSTQSSAAYGRIGSDIEVIKWPDGGKSRLTTPSKVAYIWTTNQNGARIEDWGYKCQPKKDDSRRWLVEGHMLRFMETLLGNNVHSTFPALPPGKSLESALTDYLGRIVNGICAEKVRSLGKDFEENLVVVLAVPDALTHAALAHSDHKGPGAQITGAVESASKRFGMPPGFKLRVSLVDECRAAAEYAVHSALWRPGPLETVMVLRVGQTTAASSLFNILNIQPWKTQSCKPPMLDWCGISDIEKRFRALIARKLQNPNSSRWTFNPPLSVSAVRPKIVRYESLCKSYFEKEILPYWVGGDIDIQLDGPGICNNSQAGIGDGILRLEDREIKTCFKETVMGLERFLKRSTSNLPAGVMPPRRILAVGDFARSKYLIVETYRIMLDIGPEIDIIIPEQPETAIAQGLVMSTLSTLGATAGAYFWPESREDIPNDLALQEDRARRTLARRKLDQARVNRILYPEAPNFWLGIGPQSES